MQFITFLQCELFAWQEEEKVELTPKLHEVIKILEFVQIERYLPSYRGCVGRPGGYRIEIARAFVAKQVLNLPTTGALIDRVKATSAHRKSRAF